MKVFINGQVFDGKTFSADTWVWVDKGEIVRTTPARTGLPGGAEPAGRVDANGGQGAAGRAGDAEPAGPVANGGQGAAGGAGDGHSYTAGDVPGDVPEVIDLQGNYLVPGLIDLHVMGGSGIYFSNEPTAEAVESISGAHLRYGVTSWLPTLITAPPETIFKSISAVRQAMQRLPGNVLGMHLEGPFLHPEKRGAHKEVLLRKPDDALLDDIISEGKDVIRVITIAPELFTERQLEKLLESGMRVAVAHSMVGCREAMHYFDKGIGLVTHLYNAMRQFNSREPGLVGAAFTHPSIRAAIIADGVHVDFEAVKIAQRLLKDRLYLVSDCTFIDYPFDHFEFEGVTVYNKDGKFINEEGKLAGSSITVYHAIKNCVEQGVCTLEEALAKATSIPASIMQMETRIGVIQEGARANLLVLDKDLQRKQQWLNGLPVNQGDNLHVTSGN
ncbi:N-acetylglucosamine 6-phosphate deacetylase [Anseongella ginsenosidimutans]|uniref:N-acetylglucosamine 6-phosphate deacetylase n=1 Tax=Anseongella ginsenosidimutans TaxID=496056 RepID=A0A4R3KQ22_9SPHI|nr:N-acetylglucosamine-6-phosphate deacetylase [Anseongella ginsenosidimutans]QEC53713.1 N-acetylglucosamine-6-phosphate deacetylase [Anseongella ginsenosidimutans]TCS86036.1 N-acetylglucosamine 6-phosphate deacetylase [Anseongella ginsenosidimutans]